MKPHHRRRPVYPRLGRATGTLRRDRQPEADTSRPPVLGENRHRSWPRQEPPIFKYRGEEPSREKPAPHANAIDARLRVVWGMQEPAVD